MTKLKRYQVFLADQAKQDLRGILDYILVNFYRQQAAVYVARILSAKQDWVKIFYK